MKKHGTLVFFFFYFRKKKKKKLCRRLRVKVT